MMFRMQRDVQRIGEAAGVAAAQAALAGVTPRQLDVRRLQEVLLASGLLRDEPVIEERAGTVAEWIAQLDSPQPKAAVWHLAHSEDAIPPLLTVLADGSPQARFWAAVALAMHGRPEAAPELLRCLTERSEAKVEGHRSAPFWQGAVVLLGRIGDPAAVPEILRLLREPETALDALIAAIRALGRIGDPAAVPALRALVQRDDLACERVFQVSSGGRATVSEDARWQLDLAAAEALALLGAPDASLAEKHREDPRAYVRRYAERVRQMSRIPIGY
jgi:HEAT repeat protein